MLQSTDFHALSLMTDCSLRDYQIKNKRSICELWAEKKSIMLQMPTGTGKTRLFSSLLKDIQVYANDHEI